MDAAPVSGLGPIERGPLPLQRSLRPGRTAGFPAGTAHANGRFHPMKLTIPELSLVVLIGPSGCGKSTFARRHFAPTEVLSSDFCRGLVSDDENRQDATGDAFDLL